VVVSPTTRARRGVDPLTQASALAQRALGAASGTLRSVALAGLWLLAERGKLPAWLGALLPLGLAFALIAAIRRHRHPQRGESITRLDFELASLGLLALLEAALAAPYGLSGPLSGLLYPAVALVCVFARPLASIGSWCFLTLLLSSVPNARGLGTLAPALLAALLGLTGFSLWLSVRALVERARRAARQSVDRELTRLQDAARSYRLLAAESDEERLSMPANSKIVPEAPASADPRLVRSSVEEIHAALRSCLGVCRGALGCRSMLLWWLDETGAWLHLRGVSSSEQILEGPFNAREGIFAAALESDQLVELVGASLTRPLPYYRGAPVVAHAGALAVTEDDGACGLIAFDRPEACALSPAEIELLQETARLIRRIIANERAFLQLDRAKVEQGKLYRAVERLNEARTEVQVIEAGVASARDFAAFQFAAVTLLRAGNEHEICAVSGDGADELVGKTFRDASGLVGMVVANRHPLPYRGQCDAEVQVLFTRHLHPPKLPSLLVLPLLQHRDVLGTLVLGSTEPGGFGGEARLILQVLAGHIAVSLANARMVKRLEELATTDGLTGLLNKRTATEVARQKLRSAQRFRKSLGVLICDLDHFKQVNDNYGHDVGDQVIRGFAEVLRRTKRETDTVGRIGGEEFVVVCEETDLDGAELLAERIRAELGRSSFVSPLGAVQVTCSVGVATFPEAGSDWESLFKATDEALYTSKRSGRDRITLWSSRLRAKAG
jgi:two-component system cell cycle response regulator